MGEGDTNLLTLSNMLVEQISELVERVLRSLLLEEAV